VALFLTLPQLTRQRAHLCSYTYFPCNLQPLSRLKRNQAVALCEQSCKCSLRAGFLGSGLL